MKREELVELIRGAAVAAGYAFHTGQEHRMGGAVRIWPAAWLAPPEVCSHTGRREGETVFRITLHLSALPSEGTEVETLWQGLERDALRMTTFLAESTAVCAVSNVQCTPARQSLTPHGETSVALVCDVTMWYSI